MKFECEYSLLHRSDYKVLIGNVPKTKILEGRAKVGKRLVKIPQLKWIDIQIFFRWNTQHNRIMVATDHDVDRLYVNSICKSKNILNVRLCFDWHHDLSTKIRLCCVSHLRQGDMSDLFDSEIIVSKKHTLSFGQHGCHNRLLNFCGPTILFLTFLMNWCPLSK